MTTLRVLSFSDFTRSQVALGNPPCIRRFGGAGPGNYSRIEADFPTWKLRARARRLKPSNALGVPKCNLGTRGNEECLFVVDAEVDYSAFVSMDDPDSMVHDSSESIHFALHHLSGEVIESSDIKMAVKCRLNMDSSRIEEIAGFKFIYDLIEVSGRPTEVKDDRDDEDED